MAIKDEARENIEGIYRITRRLIDPTALDIDRHFGSSRFDNNLDHLVLFEIMKDNEIWIVKSYVHKMGEEYKMIYGHVESFKKYMCHQSLIDFINSCDYMHGKGEAVTLEKVAALRELNKNDLKKFALESRFIVN